MSRILIITKHCEVAGHEFGLAGPCLVVPEGWVCYQRWQLHLRLGLAC